jgi:GntR family transcriptional regulator of arabinose operon
MRSNGLTSRNSTPGRVSRGRPKGERLRSHLMREIADGSLSPGDALVAERDLAKVMQISRSTVRQTLEDMEREGIIYRVQGKGTFVAERPNPDIANRSASVGIVVLDVASNYYLSLLSGFEDACTHAGHPTVICNSGNSVDRQANHLMRLLAHRVSGVVLNATSIVTTPPYQVELLQDAGIPVVLLHRPIPEVSAPLLEMPVEEILEQAGRMLLEAGHKHVAYFDSYRDDLSERRENSFRKVLKDAGLDLPKSHVVYGQSRTWIDGDKFDEYDQFLEDLLPTLLSQPNAPTAIFAGFDPNAEHLYLAAQRLGIRIPDDLSLLCFGGAHREGAILKRLTAITIDEVGAGKKAVELLQEMRAGRRPIKDSETIRLPLSVVVGESLARPRGAAAGNSGRARNSKFETEK